MRFTDEAGDEEVVDPSVLPVLADDGIGWYWYCWGDTYIAGGAVQG